MEDNGKNCTRLGAGQHGLAVRHGGKKAASLRHSSNSMRQRLRWRGRRRLRCGGKHISVNSSSARAIIKCKGFCFEASLSSAQLSWT
eukprot:5398625-Amphidinium_carterae.1